MEKAWCGICQEHHDVMVVKPSLELIEGCYGELYISVNLAIACPETNKQIAKGQVSLNFDCTCPECGHKHTQDPFYNRDDMEMSPDEADEFIRARLHPVTFYSKPMRGKSWLLGKGRLRGNSGVMYGAELSIPVTCCKCHKEFEVYSKEVAGLGFFKTEYDMS